MKQYAIKRHGVTVCTFDAKSDRAAKIHTSKFCGKSADIYKEICGIELCKDGKHLAYYSPFFFQWLND